LSVHYEKAAQGTTALQFLVRPVPKLTRRLRIDLVCAVRVEGQQSLRLRPHKLREIAPKRPEVSDLWHGCKRFKGQSHGRNSEKRKPVKAAVL
jgi:hypothetical protein